MSAWTIYQPSAAAPWDLPRVVHLHRRAGFAATWKELERDLAGGPEAAVSRLLQGEARLEGVPADFESLSTIIGEAAVDASSADRLKAWWVYRCLFSPHPLEERLTLMWHNHFATSNLKLNDLRLMKRQNDTLRKHAFGPFGEMLRAMVRDPALLLWLDAPANRKEHPNENLGRELMELFTLGIGNYTENDVKHAARALTGWTVKQGEFFHQPTAHDAGVKHVLNEVGRWTADDLVRILLDQAATARRLAWRITGEFFGERVVGDDAVDELAGELRKNDLNIRHGVETVLRSELFFSPANIGSRIADPVSFVIGPLRALECLRDPPSTIALAEWIARMGQDLFYPPNVGGWPGGRAWLSTRSVIARTNCMAALVNGVMNSPPRRPDFAAIARQHVAEQEGDQRGRFFAQLLTGRDCSRSTEPAPELLELLIQPESHLH